MLRFPRTISFKRLSEMPRRFAASSCPTPSGSRYSSSRISPGGIAGPSQCGSLVIVFDADFVGIAALPSERDAMLLVDAHAAATGLIALQQFQATARGNREILERGGCSFGTSAVLASRPPVSNDGSECWFVTAGFRELTVVGVR